MDMGIDSLMAMELRDRLDYPVAAGGSLPATLVFDHPSAAIATLPPGGFGGTPPADDPAHFIIQIRARPNSPIRVAGLSLRRVEAFAPQELDHLKKTSWIDRTRESLSPLKPAYLRLEVLGPA